MITSKQLIIIGTITGVVFTSIMIFMASTKDVATRKMQSQIDIIIKRMDCPDNECDRYKGKDAKRDLAVVHNRIDELEKSCACLTARTRGNK